VFLLVSLAVVGCSAGGAADADAGLPVPTGTPAPTAESQDMTTDAKTDAVVRGNTAFALDLYAKLRDRDGNIFFSPFSVSTALAMAYAGARGRTAEQMTRVLRYPKDDVHPAFGKLAADLGGDASGGYEIAVANRLWGQRGVAFREDFKGELGAHYGAGLGEVDFRTGAEEARAQINAWVEERTKGKIKDLFKPGVLNATTQLVIANAVYFKGAWARPFLAQRTEDAPFTLAPGRTATVPTMQQRASFGYFETPAFQALEMPYAGDDLSMVVLLPTRVDGLADLERSLAAEGLAQVFAGLRSQEVEVAFPKFTFTSEFDLAETLAAMGMPDAFTSGADFSGMDGTKTLFIATVVHKAFVDVNEEGTEAAAATGVGISRTSMPQRTPVFRADHPFLFMIRDRRTDAVLFLGRVADPR
jgi:serpin B